MIDFEKKYKVEGYGGVAWHAWNYEMVRDEDFEWSGIATENPERVVCVMVGDDRKFTFDVEDLTPLEDDEYCPECGQIGCKAWASS